MNHPRPASPASSKTRRPLRALLAAAGVAAFGIAGLPLGAAEIISINFGSNESSSSVTAGNSAGAILVDGANWNNTSGASGSVTALINNTGAATGVNITWSSNNPYHSSSDTTTGNGQLTKGYLDDGGDGASVTLSNLGYFITNIYVIHASDSNDNSRAISVNGVSYTSTAAGATVTGSGIWAAKRFDNGTAALTEGVGGSYLKIQGILTSTITINGNGGGGGRGGIAGVQVEDAYTGTLFHWNGGASGTWDTGTAAWLPNGTDTAQIWGAGTNQVAVFGGSASLTVSGAQTTDGIWAKTGDVVLAGDGTGILSINSNATSPAMIRIDSGSTLTLDNITVNGAELTLGGTAKIGSTGTVTFSGGLKTGGTLDLISTDSRLVLNGDKNFVTNITGSGTVDVQGQSTLNLTGAYDAVFQGTINVGQQATLATTGAPDWGTGVKTVHADGNIAFIVDYSIDWWSELFIGDGGSLTLSDSGKIVVSVSGGVTGDTFRLVILGTGATLTGPADWNNVLQATGDGIYTLTQDETGLLFTITDSGALTWAGPAGAAWTTDTSVNAWKKNGTPSHFTEGDIVFFADEGAGDVIVTGIIKPNSWMIKNSAGNDFTFKPGADPAGNYISGTTGLIKKGAGKATLQTLNDFTGAITVEGGTLEIGAGGKLGTGAIAISENATLLFNQPAGIANLNTEIGNTTGDGTLAFSGGGTYVMGTDRGKFNQRNTLVSGTGTILKLGETNVNSDTGIIKGTLTISAGAQVIVGTENAAGWNGEANKLNVVNIDHGTLTHAGNGDFGWEIVYNLTGGKMETTAAEARFSMGSGDAAANRTQINTLAAAAQSEIAGMGTIRQNILTFNVADGAAPIDLLLGAAFSGSGGIEKAGAGLMVVTGTNTYAGPTNITAGTLQVGNGGTTGTLGAGTVTIGNGLTLEFNRSAPITFNNALGGTGTLKLLGNTNLTLAGAAAISSNIIDVASPTAVLVISTETPSFVVSAPELHVAGSIKFNLSGAVSNAISITGTGVTFDAGAKIRVSGTGQLNAEYRLISATNLSIADLVGTDALSLLVNNTRAVFTLTKDASGLLLKQTGGGAAFNLIWTGTGSNIWKAGDNTIVNWKKYEDDSAQSFVNGDMTTFDGTAAGDVIVTGLLEPGSWTVNNAAGADYVFKAAGDAVLTNYITGATGLTKTGAGKITILTNNDFAGSVSIQDGIVQVGNGTVGGALGGTGNITVNTGASLVYNLPASQPNTFDRVVTGGGSFVKDGDNVMTRSFVSSTVVGIQGEFIVNRGTVILDTGGWYQELPANSLTINGGTVITTRDHSFGSDSSGVNMPVTINAGGILQLGNSANNGGQYIRQQTLTLNGGKIQPWTNGTATGNGNVRIANSTGPINVTGAGSEISTNIHIYGGTNLSFQVSAGADIRLSRTITEESSGKIFNKTGDGLAIISGTGSYTGATNIIAGTLQLGDGGTTGSIDTSSGITIADGATLAFKRSNESAYDYTGPAITGTAGSFVAIKGATEFTVSDTNKAKYNAFLGTFKNDAGAVIHGNLNFGPGRITDHPGNNLVVGGILSPGADMATGAMTFKDITLEATAVVMSKIDAPNAASDIVNATGILTFSTGAKIQPFVINIAATDENHPYTLFTYGTITGLPSDLSTLINKSPAYNDYDFTLTNDTVAKQIKLTIADSGGKLLWLGVAPDWKNNGSVVNWRNTKTNNTQEFADGLRVIFDDTGIATANITITDEVKPKSWAIANETGTYTFSGANAASKVSGTGGLTKTGAGSAIILTQNDFTGAVTINGGTLQIGNGTTGGALGGTGTVTLGTGATLTYKLPGIATDEVTLATLLGAAGRTITGDGTFVKDGLGIIKLDQIGLYNQAHTIVNAGTLELAVGGETGAIKGTLTVNAGATLKSSVENSVGWGANAKINEITVTGGTITHSGDKGFGWGIAYHLDSASLVAATATSHFAMGNGTVVNVNNAGAGQTVISGAGYIDIREGNNTTTHNLEFNVADGTAPVDLLISAGIRGRQDNNAGPQTGITKTGTGTMEISGVASYTGKTIVNAGTLKFSNATAPTTTAIEIADGAKFQSTAGLTLNNTNASFAGSATPTTDITGNISLTGGHTLSIGNGVGIVAALGIDGELTLDNSVIKFDFANTSSYDQITATKLITGTGAGTNNIQINTTTSIAVGDYTLITGTGTGSITLSSFALTGVEPERGGLVLNTADNSLVLRIHTAILDLTWAGTTGATWTGTPAPTNKPWTYDKAGVTTPASFANGDVVNFHTDAPAGVIREISIVSAVAPSTINVTGSGPAGDTITFTNSGTGKITGTGGINKSGTGTLVLNNAGANDYSGAVIVSGGVLEITGTGPAIHYAGYASALGNPASDTAANLVLSGGATLRFAGTGSNETDRNLTIGTGGAGIETTNTTAGSFVRFYSTAAAQTGTGDRNLTLGGASGTDAVAAGAAGAVGTSGGVFSLSIQDGPGGAKLRLIKTGTGTWVLNDPGSTYSGGTIIEGGMLSISKLSDSDSDTVLGAAPAAPDAANITIKNGATLANLKPGTGNALLQAATSTLALSPNRGITLDNGGQIRVAGADFIINGSISGTGSLTKTDTGTLVLLGTNGFSGGTVVAGGTLRAVKSAIPTNTDMTVNAGAVLELATYAEVNDPSVNIRNLAGGGIIRPATGITSAGLFITDTNDTTFSGQITDGSDGGRLNLRKLGTGTLTLSGNNTTQGIFAVLAGTLRAGSDNAFGQNYVSAFAGGTVDINGFNIAARLSIQQGTTLLNTSTGITGKAGDINISGGTIRTTGTTQLEKITGGNAVLEGTAANSAFILTGTNAAVTNTGSITLKTKLTANVTGSLAPASLIVTGSNANLILDTDEVIAAASALSLADNAKLTVNGANSQTLNALTTDAGALITHNADTATTGTIVLNTDAGDGTLNARIGGTNDGSNRINLTKTGDNTLEITNAANNYTGVTTISGGVLDLVAALNNGTGGGALGSTANTAASQLILEDCATLRISATGLNTTNKLFTIAGNEVTIESNGGGVKFTGTGTIGGTDATTLVLAGTNADSFTGTTANALASKLDGARSLAVDGGSTWLVSGQNTYTGSTQVRNGTLALGATNALPATTVVTLGTGTDSGIFALNGRSITIAGLETAGTGANNAVINGALAAGALTVNAATDFTFAGAFGTAGNAADNNFSVTKSGIGTLTLTGPTSYTGKTTVTEGTLALTHTDAPASTEFIISANATLEIPTLTLGTGTSLTAGSDGTHTDIRGNITLAGGTITIGGIQNQPEDVNNILKIAGDLTITGTSKINFTISPSVTGTNSEVVVNNLTLSGSELLVNMALESETLETAVYQLIHYTGITATGSDIDNIKYAPTELRYNITFRNDTDDNVIVMDVSAKTSGKPLVWVGDLQNAAGKYQWGNPSVDGKNFVREGEKLAYTGGDYALFDDTGVNTDVTVSDLGVKLGYITFDNSAKNYVVSGGNIAGLAGIIVKKGTGTLSLLSANSYGGGTVLEAGTLIIGNNSALGTGIIQFQGGTLAGNGSAYTLANRMAVNTASVIDAGTAGLTMSGTIIGTGTLVKKGTGALTLTGNGSDTMIGGTTVVDFTGTVQVNQGAVALGAPVNQSRATYNLAGAGTSLVAAFAGDGSVQIGALTGGENGATVTADGAGAKTFVIGGANSATAYTGTIADGTAGNTLGITKVGTGMLTLAGNNTYTGATGVQNGTLQITGTLAPTASIDIAAGGTFAVNTNKPNETITAKITGDGTFAKLGDNKLTLTTDNDTLTGIVDIQGGTLALAGAGTLGTARINNNANLILERTGDYILANNITGSGVLEKTGTGNLTYTGNSTNTGITKLTAGTLTLGGTAPATQQIFATGEIQFAAGTALNLETGADSVLRLGAAFSGNAAGTAAEINKIGAGTVIVSAPAAGTNAAGLRLNINEGVYQLGDGYNNGEISPGIAVNVADNATLRLNSTRTVTFTGPVTSTGNIEQLGGNVANGTAILASTGNLIAGIIQIKGGALQVGDDGHQDAVLNKNNAPVTANITGGAKLVYAVSGNAGENVTLVGSGTFEKQGSGTMTFAGKYDNFTGIVAVTGGTLAFDRDNLPTNNDLVAGGTGVLEIRNGANAYTLNSRITGTGTLSLAADNTIATGNRTVYDYAPTGITGTIRVNDRTLLNLGTDPNAPVTASRIDVYAGGLLKGQSSIAGTLHNHTGGRIEPGNSVGQIYTDTFINNGTLQIEINNTGAGGYDQVHYTTSADLTGGTVEFVLSKELYNSLKNTSAKLTFLANDTAGGNITVTGIDATTGYKSVFLVDGEIVSAFTKTTSSGGVLFFANNIFDTLDISEKSQIRDGLGDYIRYLDNIFQSADTTAAADTLNALLQSSSPAKALNNASPVGLASMTAMTITGAHDNMNIRRQHLESLRYEVGRVGAIDLTPYVSANGVFVKNGGNRSNPAFDFNTYGGTVGLDKSFGEKMILGTSIDYRHGNATIKDNGGKVQQDSGIITAYGSYLFTDYIYLDLGVFGGYDSYDIKHDTALGRATAKPDGFNVGGNAYLGGIIPVTSQVHFTPYAGLEYVYADVSDFSEKGSAAALKVDGFSQSSLQAKVGTGINWVIPTGKEYFWRVGLNAAYAYEILDDEADISARFANDATGNKFNVNARTTPRQSMQIGPSMEFRFDENKTISLDYTFEYDFENQYIHHINAAFRMRF